MGLIRSYGRIFKLLFIFGLCPFFVNKQINQVKCSICSILYSIIFIILILFALGITAIIGLLQFVANNSDEDFEEDSTEISWTLLVSESVQVFFIVFSFSSTVLMTIIKCSKIVSVINGLIQIESVFDGLTDRNMELSKNYMQFIPYLLIIIYFSLITIYTVYTVSNVIFFTCLSIVLITASLSSLHIRDLGIILLKNFKNFRIQFELSIQNNSFIMNSVNLISVFDSLWNLKRQLNDCFGTQMLLHVLTDFVLITTVIFAIYNESVLYDVFYDPEIGIFILVFIIPITVKAFLLTRIMDALSDQVNDIFHINNLNC